MTDEMFDLVFRGEIVKSVDINVAKRNLQQLFKIPAGKIEVLFSGKPIVLKRGLTCENANKYRVAIKKAGALVDVVVHTPADTGASSGVASKAPRSTQASPSSASPEAISSSKPPNTPPINRPAATKNTSADLANAPLLSNHGSSTALGHLSVLPVGSDVLKPDERMTDVSADLDLSEYSLRDLNGSLLDDDEIEKELPVNIQVNLDVAPVGAKLLTDAEKEEEVPRPIDVSDLSMAQVGVTLGESKPDKAKAPDTSHITLKE